MSRQMLRTFLPTLSVVLFFATPINAEPISVREVLQIVGSYQNAPELRLLYFSQGDRGSIVELQPARMAPSPRQLTADASTEIFLTPALTLPPNGFLDSLLTGVLSGWADSRARSEIVYQGPAGGMLCECGEITVPSGGLRKWPLLFLAAVPLFFIDACDDCATPASTPGSTPAISEMPEPASLVLLGSGLAVFGAGLRRRYVTGRLAKDQ